MKTIELLAPAKDLETGKEAINCGADAVYIGASKYGARSAAGNSLEEIEELVNYAHLFHAKVYLALNTLLFNNEINDAVELIHKAYNIGIDAVIIQDMGLLEFDLPPIAIHASTQTDNRDIEKIRFLENTGFERVILARELSNQQIKNINRETNIELEYFVHGALCVSYSGKCYMSAHMKNRSANRGNCMQACRLPFTLEDINHLPIGSAKHYLSLKDLNRSSNIEELIEAGITSFKIEGRLKDIGYVKNITTYYRNQIDKYLEKSINLKKASSGISISSFIANPQKSFNRGFTEYFVHGENEKVASLNSPKSLGEPIGFVVEAGKDWIKLNDETVIAPGDGICYFDKHERLNGFYVNKIESDKIYLAKPVRLDVNTYLFRNQDNLFEKELKKVTERKIELFFKIEDHPEGVKIVGEDEDAIISSHLLKFDKEIARNSKKAIINIEEQLLKTGNSVYKVKSIKYLAQSVYFIPNSLISKTRREILELHDTNRLKVLPIKKTAIKKNSYDYPEKALNFEGNITNDFAYAFYKRHGVINIEEGFETNMRKYRELKLMTTKYCLKYELEICPVHQKHIQTKIAEPKYLKTGKHKFKIEYDCKKCEMNIYAI